MKFILFMFSCILFISCSSKPTLYCVADKTNDICVQLEKEGYKILYFNTPEEAITKAPKKGSVMMLTDGAIESGLSIDSTILGEIEKKQLRVYAEYCSQLPGVEIAKEPLMMRLERAVVVDSTLDESLSHFSLMTINGSFIQPMKRDSALIVMATVAGFDKAEYGLTETTVYPLLFKYNDRLMVSSASLSNFATARFAPEQKWKNVWEYVIGWLTASDKKVEFKQWLSFVYPTYNREEPLAADARKNAVGKGIEWFFNGHFLIDESWKADWYEKYQGDGTMPVGPELPADAKNGDGTLGVLEGHNSFIYHDGKQQYRYWLRNDVQGESAFAFAVAGKLLDKKEYLDISKNLSDFSFKTFRDGPRNDIKSPTYGLLGWSITHPGTYYGDDNARSILGMIGAASLIGTDQWDKALTEAILANFRTTGVKGFRGNNLLETDIQKNGWQHYWESEAETPHPHFESWMWACYLWLYDKTGYEPLMDRSLKGIEITMAGYPDKWSWTNGIQQERARMILPLAWLVRVSPTEQHKQWLNFMVDELLKNQVECGAIREELGDAKSGMFGKTTSNAAYGLHEAPLIFENGDPVADMLYTSNFAFFALNEAAKATLDPKHIEAVHKLSDFLTRVQVRSDKFKSVDGAWFRAFNYQNWDYWASNADAGWGAWSTLTGWIQSWIVGTQGLIEMDSSLWDITKDSKIKTEMDETVQMMFEK